MGTVLVSDAHRFVEVRGDPGVGKSWVLRHLAERVARQAPIIVLDRDATPPGGWLPFSNILGIPGSAVEFLTDLAASGGAMLFMTVADRSGLAECVLFPDAYRACAGAVRGEVVRVEGRVDGTLGAITLVAEHVGEVAGAD